MRIAGAALFVAAALSATPTIAAARAAGGTVVIDGEGAGHGVGMAQDGALAMGRAGATSSQILEFFYPGTQHARRTGEVSVRVQDGPDKAVAVSFPAGGRIVERGLGAQPPGFPIAVPAGLEATVVRESPGYRIHVDAPIVLTSGAPSTTSTTIPKLSTTPPAPASTASSTPSTVGRLTAPSAPTTPSTVRRATPSMRTSVPTDVTTTAGLRLEPATGSTTALIARGRRYRGVIDVDTSVQGGLAMVNQLDVEEYLKGMGEVLDPSWPPAALQAQAVAARTYALRAVSAGGDLCDDDRCQVYLGADVEYGAMDAAVQATRGDVLLYGNQLASTVYSASAGGRTASPEEGFGVSEGDYPYLVAKPYDDPAAPRWTMSFELDEVARRLGYAGEASGLAVTSTGPSGRPLTVALTGSGGTTSIPGVVAVTRLGFPSTLFRVRNSQDLAQTPAARLDLAASPGPADQVLPDDVPRTVTESIAAVTRQPRSSAAHAVVSELALLVAGLLAIADRRRRAARQVRP